MHVIFCTHYADWEWVLENKSVTRPCGTRENKQTNMARAVRTGRGFSVLFFRLNKILFFHSFQDGSDEPGTAACSNGSFYCSNRGFKPSLVPSSRVNDGICDCCDGADEWTTELANPCVNNCLEQGAAEREERERLSKVIEEGIRLKSDLVAQGSRMKTEKEAELQVGCHIFSSAWLSKLNSFKKRGKIQISLLLSADFQLFYSIIKEANHLNH
jgi:hypothetical protein